MSKQSITLHAFREEVPGRRWQALYEATWPAYRSWYLREGVAARPSVAEAEERPAPAHARARADLAAARVTDRRGAPQQRDAQSLGDAGVRAGMFAGGGK